MLKIEAVNHIGIRIREKFRSMAFYEVLGFELQQDVGFEEGHPIIMQHPSGVVLNLLGPARGAEAHNVLMDEEEKFTGITHFALTVTGLEETRRFVESRDIAITGSFSFGGMSAIFIRDPDRNVIELDAYDQADPDDMSGYANHP
ncbi:MAG: VOC family protein [Gammaproteobacteria bacterium]|nr:VOC family protein [Gammaproteobacteria bacterium]